MDENEIENETPETPAPETPAVETPAVEQPVIPEGYISPDEAKALREQLQAAQTERETAQAERDAALTTAQTAAADARTATIRSHAAQLGFNDPADAVSMIAADVTDIEGALASLIEAKPYLKRAAEVVQPPVTPTSPTNPARTEAVTAEQLKTMTAAQVAALPWEVVSAALAG
ncbi:MAG: hypothetical protein WCF57_20235 [Pyrinomonadaceae bacterium]